MRRDVQARPNRSPARNWRPSMPDRSSRTTRVTARRRLVGVRLALGACSGSGRSSSSAAASGSARSAIPTARSARPTARTWAWYQVVPSCAAYQSTVPKARKSGRGEADPAPDRQAPEHPPGDPDVDGGDDREDELAVGVVTPGGDERQQQDGRQRWKRDVAARHAVVGRDLPDVVEEGVAGRVGGGLDRIPDRGLALEEGLRLPLEVVVEPKGLGVRVDDQGDRDQDEPDGGRRQRGLRRAAAPRSLTAACRVRSGPLRSTLCYPAIHLRMLVQEASLR